MQSLRAFSSYSSRLLAAFDVRSDTVTRPTSEMLTQMVRASLGDDVYNEDPDTILLEKTIADLSSKEAGLFCVTCTMANQLAMAVHMHTHSCSRTSFPSSSFLGSLVCYEPSHVFQYEGNGIGLISRSLVIPVPSNSQLQQRPKTEIDVGYKPGKRGCAGISSSMAISYTRTSDDVHVAKTGLMCLENTLNGEILPVEDIKDIHNHCEKNGISMHLDGARLLNATVASQTSVSTYTSYFNSASLCLAKGIGAPLGAVLVGSKEFIHAARKLRKILGGGLHQSGLIARAGLFGLENYEERLKNDHSNAHVFAVALIRHGVEITHPVETNMVWADFSNWKITDCDISEFLKKEKHPYILSSNGSSKVRFVFHYEISNEATVRLAESVITFLKSLPTKE